jgi:hypothetical protein
LCGIAEKQKGKTVTDLANWPPLFFVDSCLMAVLIFPIALVVSPKPGPKF